MFFQDVGASLFRPSDYAAFARRPARRAVVYLLLLSLPLVLLVGLRLGTAVHQATSLLADSAAKSPDFRVVGGFLEFDGPQPYYLLAGGTVIGVVDTTGATSRADLAGRQQYILVLRDRIIIRDGLQTQELAFADLATLGQGAETFTRDSIVRVLRSLSALSLPLGALWASLNLTAKFISAFALALIALVTASVRRKQATMAVAWNVACHALTLPLIAALGRSLIQADIKAFSLFYWGAALVYVVAAVGFLPPATAGVAVSDPPSGPHPPSGRHPPV